MNDIERAKLEAMAKAWMMQADSAFRCGERTNGTSVIEQMGKRLVEHGAMVAVNHATELLALLREEPKS